MKSTPLLLAVLLCAPFALSMNDQKDTIRAYLKAQKNIDYHYNLADIHFIGEGEADFIFAVDRSRPSILVTGSVSHCVTLILYSSEKGLPFAFMAHMNEHNTWEALKEMFNHAMRDYEELYATKLKPEHLKAIALSGAVETVPSDPKLGRDIYLVLQRDLGILFDNIDTKYFRDGVTSFHDILFDAINLQLDVNHFDIFLSNEEKGFLTKDALEIPRSSAVGTLMDLQQTKMRPSFAAWANLHSNDSSPPFTAPLARAQKSACYKCAKVKENIPHCKACKVIEYCSATCQKNDWPRHQKECKKLSATSNH